MKNSKAVETVRDLYLLGGDEAVERYNRFLITNKKNHLSAFLSYVSAHLDDEEKLDKEKVYRKVFRSKTYNRRRLENLAHHSVKESMNFIMTDALFMREFLQQKMKADYYKMKQWKEAYIEVVTHNLENFRPAEEGEWHLAKADFYYNLYFSFRKDVNDKEDYLAISRHHFDIHAAIVRIKADCEVLTRKTWGGVLPEAFEESLAYFILSLSPRVKAVPLVGLLLKSADFLSKPSLDKYFALKTDFMLHFEELRDDRKFLLRCLTNGLNFVDFPGGRQAEEIQLYKIGVEHKLFVNNGWMNEFLFDNIISVASQLGDFSFAQDVLETHKPFVGEEMFETTERFFAALVLFDQGKYEEAIEELGFNRFKKFPFDLRRFVLHMKCLYEIDKTGADALEDLARKFWRSLRKKLKDGKGSYGELPLRIKHFSNILNEIARPTFLIRYSKEELLEKLDGFQKQIVEKSWLKEKIAELKR